MSCLISKQIMDTRKYIARCILCYNVIYLFSNIYSIRVRVKCRFIQDDEAKFNLMNLKKYNDRFILSSYKSNNVSILNDLK